MANRGDGFASRVTNPEKLCSGDRPPQLFAVRSARVEFPYRPTPGPYIALVPKLNIFPMGTRRLPATPPSTMLFEIAPAVVDAATTLAPVEISFCPPYFVESVVTPG